MQAEEPIFVDDPTILASIARLAAALSCTEEEAIGFAVTSELKLQQAIELDRQARHGNESPASG